jgi:hypothetical protein
MANREHDIIERLARLDQRIEALPNDAVKVGVRGEFMALVLSMAAQGYASVSATGAPGSASATEGE